MHLISRALVSDLSTDTVNTVGEPSEEYRGRDQPDFGAQRPEVQLLAGHPEEERAARIHDLETSFSEPLRDLRKQGFQLVTGWPRQWNHAISSAVGHRFFLGHARHFSPTTKLASVVCSRMGRLGAKLPEWPCLLDSVLRQIRKLNWTLLDCPSITLAEPTREFARAASIPITELVLPQRPGQDLRTWFAECFERIQDNPHSRQMVFVSPEFSPNLPWGPTEGTECSKAKLADVLSILMPDFVHAISIREKGTLRQLSNLRIASPKYKAGSFFECIWDHKGKAASRSQPRGVVGLHVVLPNQTNRATPASSDPVNNDANQLYQLCCRLPHHFQSERTHTPEQEQWLTHCTRGNQGQRPEESAEQFRARVFADGRLTTNDPFDSLLEIVRTMRLSGSRRRNRDLQASISFSEVPVGKLLERRCFQSHLGRWDWEPYGLCIRKSVLQRYGCRPVIYGGDAKFTQLPKSERPFFQSAGRNAQWTVELEWRVLGQLDLQSISADDLRFFVKSRKEAGRLARLVKSPVYWVQ